MATDIIPTDFFVPKSNEKELIDNASRTGCKIKALLYPLQNFQTKDKEARISFPESYDDSLFTGIILTGNYNERQFLNAKNLTDYVVLEANQNLRAFIERFDNFFVFGAEKLAEKDFIHQRDSGLNQILVTMATKKNITFLFNVTDFISQSAKNKAILIGRFGQNIRIFSQYKCSYQAATFAENKYEVKGNLDPFINILKMNYNFD
jgi:hypothetical protein